MGLSEDEIRCVRRADVFVKAYFRVGGFFVRRLDGSVAGLKGRVGCIHKKADGMNRKERRKAASEGIRIPPSGRAHVQLAAAWRLLDLVRQGIEVGKFEEARQYVGFAMQLFERYSGVVGGAEGVAHCSLFEGYMQWRFGDLLGSKERLREAVQRFGQLGDEANEAASERQLGVTLGTLKLFDEAWEHIESARRTFIRLNLPVEAARADVELAKFDGHEGRPADAERRLFAAQSTLEAAGLLMPAADALLALAIIYTNDRRPVEAESVLRECIRRYRALENGPCTAMCEADLGKILQELAQPKEALASALSAIRGFDGIRYQLSNPLSRDRWASYLHKAQTVALEIAAVSGDVWLAAELIESARLQVVPAIGDQAREQISTPAKTPGDRPPPDYVSINSLPLSPSHPISIAGATRLRRKQL